MGGAMGPGELSPRWRGVHHLALITPDMDATVRFWCGALGARLVATLATETFRHYFFEFGPGSTIAFFEYKGVDLDFFAKPAGVPTPQASQFDHLSLALPDEDALHALRSRLKEAGCEVTDVVDHGIMRSIYFTDPAGIALEASFWVTDATGRPAGGRRPGRRPLPARLHAGARLPAPRPERRRRGGHLRGAVGAAGPARPPAGLRGPRPRRARRGPFPAGGRLLHRHAPAGEAGPGAGGRPRTGPPRRADRRARSHRPGGDAGPGQPAVVVRDLGAAGHPPPRRRGPGLRPRRHARRRPAGGGRPDRDPPAPDGEADRGGERRHRAAGPVPDGARPHRGERRAVHGR